MKYKVQFLGAFLRVSFANKGVLRSHTTPAAIEEAIKRYHQGDVLQLQDFIGDYLLSEWQWMTRISIIDAMDAIYKDAIDNANIQT